MYTHRIQYYPWFGESTGELGTYPSSIRGDYCNQVVGEYHGRQNTAKVEINVYRMLLFN